MNACLSLLAGGLLVILVACDAQSFNTTAVLEKLSQGYDRRVRPNWGGAPVDVAVTMYFIRIYDISTKDQNMKLDFYLRHTWVDPRLAFDAPPEVHFISLGPEASKMFWEPDTFSPDGHSTQPSHDGNYFYRIGRDGTILKSIRVMMKIGVSMDLCYFPMDRQMASLSLESYGSSTKDLTYRWQRKQQSVGISDDAGTSEMSIVKFQLENPTVYLTMGNYSRLQVNFVMARKGGYYLSHFYLPAVISFLFVWASFWFHPTVTVARVLLVLAAFLTNNLLLAATWNHAPVADYSTMLEKYIVFGMIMTALAIAECALVVYVQRRVRKTCQEASLLEGGGDKPVEKKQDADVDQSKQGALSYVVRSSQYLLTIHQHRRSYQKVDVFFRVVYPLIYIVYNIWYWMAFP